MSLSINTNVGALTALSVLNQTNKSLETTQARISSGFRVATAKDDAASYSIASKMRSDVAGFEAVKIGLGIGEATVGTAIKAAEAIKELLVEMKAKAVQAQGGGLTDDDRHALNDDVNKLQDQIDNIVRTAEFNDKNLIKQEGDSMSVVADVSGTSQIQIDAIALDQVSLGLMLDVKAWDADADEDGNGDNQKIGDVTEKDVNTDDLKKRYSYDSSKDLYYEGDVKSTAEAQKELAVAAKDAADKTLNAANALFDGSTGGSAYTAKTNALDLDNKAKIFMAVGSGSGTGFNVKALVSTAVGHARANTDTASVGGTTAFTQDSTAHKNARTSALALSTAAATALEDANDTAAAAKVFLTTAETVKADADALVTEATAALTAATAAKDATAIQQAEDAKTEAEAAAVGAKAIYDKAVEVDTKAAEVAALAKTFNDVATKYTLDISTATTEATVDQAIKDLIGDAANYAAGVVSKDAEALLVPGGALTGITGDDTGDAKKLADDYVTNVANSAHKAQSTAATSAGTAENIATAATTVADAVAETVTLLDTAQKATASADEAIKLASGDMKNAYSAVSTVHDLISKDKVDTLTTASEETKTAITTAKSSVTAALTSATSAEAAALTAKDAALAAYNKAATATDAGDDAEAAKTAAEKLKDETLIAYEKATAAKTALNSINAELDAILTVGGGIDNEIGEAADALTLVTTAQNRSNESVTSSASAGTLAETAKKAADLSAGVTSGSESTAVTQLRDRIVMIDITSGDKTSVDDVKRSQELIDEAIDKVTEALAYFGSVSKQLEIQKDFTQGLIDQLNIGIGTLVDADMAQESAMLQSLQIKQNLGTQALGIANAAPQTILGLFG